jgi:cytochrome c oxidase subunit III
MATTVHEPPGLGPSRPGGEGSSGNSGQRNLAPSEGNLRGVKEVYPPQSSTAIWVVLAAITMSFAAFTSALIVRQGSASDWRHLTLPSVLYLNTLVLVASSVTLELARRRVAVSPSGWVRVTGDATRWLYLTLGLGLLFVAGQYAAWRQLSSQGVYLATNPSSSFFYVLTAAHGLHVLGGLGGLIHVIGRLGRSALRRNTLEAASRYWHFMAILWLYLLFLLWTKL